MKLIILLKAYYKMAFMYMDNFPGIDTLAQYFKYYLKCNSCSWETTFYESAGSIYLDDKKIKCPICKRKTVKSTVKNPLDE